MKRIIMMKNNIIIAITEGEKTEPQILNNIQSNFFSTDKRNIEILSFKTHIYTLFKKLKEDNFETDVVELLRELDEANETKLAGIERDDVQEVYLFFDYDGHVNTASDSIISEMITIFDNETENGKLYISYPMVESLKDITSVDFCCDNCTIKKENFINYKNIVSKRSSYIDLTRISKDDWISINRYYISKTNCLLNNVCSIPNLKEISNYFDQSKIFESQVNKYITHNMVMILSGFPLFLVDYFGESVVSSKFE